MRAGKSHLINGLLSREIFEYSGASRASLTNDQIRRARHAYYAMVSHLDDRVGRILGALDAAHLSQDTVVVIMSDHGNMLGERGLWGLRMPFEWCMRVPFVFHCPDKFAPRRVATPVSLLDLLPTLVELASGASVEKLANPVDGISLVSHLNAHGSAEERDILVEYCSEGFELPWLMVRRGRYKLVYCERTPSLLFDLENDPEERSDLAADPAYASTVEELRSELLSRWDVSGLPGRIAESRQRRATIFEANNCGRAPVWDHAVDNDPYRTYQRNYREAWQKTEERALLR